MWSWLDIKVSGDTAIVLPGYKQVRESGKLEDSTAIVRLDDVSSKLNNKPNAANIKLKVVQEAIRDGFPSADSIKWWRYKLSESPDTVIYLKKEKRGNDYYLSFTAKLAGNNRPSDWTNGYPSLFKYKDGTEEKDAYYGVDTSFMAVLDSVYAYTFKPAATRPTSPYDSLSARYVYKNNDDSWRPLYVKVQYVDDSTEAKRKYEYVESRLLKERKLLDTKVTQEVDLTGLSDKYISNGRVGDEINLTGKEGAASFFITLADTIRTQHPAVEADRHWFTKEQYAYSNRNKKFENVDSVELFKIKNENGLYLTVAGKSAFNPPLKNAMRWDSVLNEDGESVRQMFAIVRNCFDDTYTFLPVAAHDWAEGGDTLSFNLNIGRDNTDGKIVDIEGAWRLESSLSHQVVVADTTSEREPLRLKLSSPLHLWNRANGVVALKDKESGVFYRGDNTTAYKDVLKKNDIGALWKVEKDWADGKYKFTPVLTAAGKQAFADTVLTVYSADDITVQFELNDTTKKYKYEIEVVDNSDEDFDLYTGFDFEWNNNKGFVTLRSGDGRYISYGSKDHPEEVLYKDEVSTVTIHKDTEGVLFSGTDYPVQYYRFSYKKDKDNYFLKAEGSIISWEKGINPETNPRYKFSMPEAFDAGKFYLQHKDGALIQVSKDGTKLSLATEQTVYSALNAINDAKEPLTLQWTIAKADVPAQWATVDIGADSTSSVGVLAVRGAGETFVGRDGTNGVLRDKTVAGSVLLKVKAAQVYSPQSVSVVAYSQATAESDVRVDYYIIHEDSLYLTERTDGSVVFEKSETHNRFAFLATEDGFAIVSGDEEDYHYLTSTGLSLHFT
ncbi:MAG: hypothetical protein LBB73_03480, partial [Dysgonamonadaceae bacterium]|nr:hypothetical protein [Dysgonamonadaceae bacterium]